MNYSKEYIRGVLIYIIVRIPNFKSPGFESVPLWLVVWCSTHFSTVVEGLMTALSFNFYFTDTLLERISTKILNLQNWIIKLNSKVEQGNFRLTNLCFYVKHYSLTVKTTFVWIPVMHNFPYSHLLSLSPERRQSRRNLILKHFYLTTQLFDDAKSIYKRQETLDILF